MNRKKGTTRSRYILALGLALLAFAIASSHAADYTVVYQLPTSNQDGTPLQDAFAVRYYYSASSNAFEYGTTSSNFVLEVAAVTNAPAGEVLQVDTLTIASTSSNLWVRATVVDDANQEGTPTEAVRLDAKPGKGVIIIFKLTGVRRGDQVEASYALNREEWKALHTFRNFPRCGVART